MADVVSSYVCISKATGVNCSCMSRHPPTASPSRYWNNKEATTVLLFQSLYVAHTQHHLFIRVSLSKQAGSHQPPRL